MQLQPDQPRKWHQTALLNGRWRLVNDAELYDVERDRAQAQNVVTEFPEIAAALRRDYDIFWRELDDCFAQRIAIPVGTPYEDPVLLSARDWHPTHGRVPWKQCRIDDPFYDANGFWDIEVARSGRYKIELRTHPREAERAMGAAGAMLHIGDLALSTETAAEDPCVAFDCELDVGETSLHTAIWNANGDRERGAYYVYVTKQ